jgi:hypothetical protein
MTTYNVFSEEGVFEDEWDEWDDGEDIFTLEEFKEAVKDGLFNNYDGSGVAAIVIHDVVEKFEGYVDIYHLEDVPEGTTHIVWFNK